MKNKYSFNVNIQIAIISVIAAIMAYFIITSDSEVDFNINWNMFESILLGPLYIIGFVVGLGQKFQVYTPVIETTYSDGRKEIKKDEDLIENMTAGCLMPLLNYFVFYPLGVAAAIYYSLMLIVYLFAVIFPFIIVGFLIFSLFVIFAILKSQSHSRWPNILMPITSTISITVFWLCYVAWVAGHFDPNYTMAMYIALGGGILTILSTIVVTQIKMKNPVEEELVDATPQSYMSRKTILSYFLFFVLVVSVIGYKMYSTPSFHSDYMFNSHTLGEKHTPLFSDESETKETQKKATESKSKPASTEQTAPLPSQTAATTKSAINIKETTGLINSFEMHYDVFYNAKRISPAERISLKIDQIDKRLLNSELVKGKVFFAGSSGRLETFLHVLPDDDTFEYLVSYDGSNNYVNHLCLGELGAYSGSRSFGTITNNKITLFSYLIDEEEEYVTFSEYQINPDLTFVQTKEWQKK